MVIPQLLKIKYHSLKRKQEENPLTHHFSLFTPLCQTNQNDITFPSSFVESGLCQITHMSMHCSTQACSIPFSTRTHAHTHTHDLIRQAIYTKSICIHKYIYKPIFHWHTILKLFPLIHHKHFLHIFKFLLQRSVNNMKKNALIISLDKSIECQTAF